MQNSDIQQQIQKIADAVNGYTQSKDLKFTEEIRKVFRQLFHVDKVRFWKYNAAEETLSIFGSQMKNTVTLSESLTKEAIASKVPLLANHVSSNKYYMPEIDNPLQLKIKSLLIFPVIKEGEVIGVLKLWRGVRQKALFVKQDEVTLQILEPLLLHLFEERTISGSLVQELSGLEKESIPAGSQEVSHKGARNVKKQISSEKENTSEELSRLEEAYAKSQEKVASLEALLAQHEEIAKEFQYLKADLKLHEKKKAEYEHQINDYITSLKMLEESYQKQFENMQTEYEAKYKEMHDKHEAQTHVIAKLKEEKEEQDRQIGKLKSNVMVSSQKNSFGKLEENMEWLFKEYDNVFGEKESAFMMFEMLIYALDSQKGMAFIDEKIEESKLLPLLMDGYYFKGNIDVFNEKTLITDIVKHIQRFEKSIFLDTCKVDVKTDDKMPLSLVLDTPKIQNIVYHLLSDLRQVVDPGKNVTVTLKYEDKFFKIEIDGIVQLQNNLFKSFFKQKKINSYEKDKPGLILSRKLVERLKGSLESDCINEHYRYMISIPVQVIKM